MSGTGEIDLAKDNEAFYNFMSSLGDSSISVNVNGKRPFVVTANINNITMDLVVYLFNCGDSTGDRPADEYKVCLSLPGQKSGISADFDFDRGFVLLVGFVKTYNIFVLWDAYKHINFGYRSNVQIKFDTIMDAFVNGISYQERDTRYGWEKIICSTGQNLVKSIGIRYELYLDDLLKTGPEKRIISRDETMTEIRKLVREAKKANPRISVSQLAKKFNISEQTIKYHLEVLKYNNDLEYDEIPESVIKGLKEEITNCYMENPNVTLGGIVDYLDISMDFLLHYYTELIENNTILHESGRSHEIIQRV